MLHEILLSLSGQPSPLFDQALQEGNRPRESLPLLSPPERALLKCLAQLGRLHGKLRAHTSLISSKHPSTICRAVSTAILTEQLGRFQRKILEVEKAILLKDSAYVGGYGIVPLSTVVGDFAPWTRRMEWLWEVARFMLPESAKNDRLRDSCSAAAIMDYLRKESQTGYVDLEEMALSLVKVAETAWMRQVSMWVLYGNLPQFGKEDFFIQEVSEEPHGRQEARDFAMHVELLPKFVPSAAASSILFIGKSINHIRTREIGSFNDSTTVSMSHLALHGDPIRQLVSLSSPISPAALFQAVNSIRLSLSQTALSHLLPLPKIREILSLLHNFMLLGRGEFPMALVTFADEKIRARHRSSQSTRSVRANTSALDGVTIKEGEMAAVLAQTWSELYSLQNEEAAADDELDFARDLLQLSIGGLKPHRPMTPSRDASHTNTLAEISSTPFDDLLFSTPVTLSIRVHPPLNLFLSSSDTAIYSSIHAYLLGIRRAQIRLSDLWKHSSLRRIHPSPWGPPLSNKRGGQARLKAGRDRVNARTKAMRPVWATASASNFVLSELGNYLQGEVVNGSWSHFMQWLNGTRPSTSSRSNSRPGTSSSATTKLGPDASRPKSVEEQRHVFEQQDHSRPPTNDPETLTAAHRIFLTSLAHALFLTDAPFTTALRSLLRRIDHFIALITRLQTVQQALDLEADEGVVDTLANHAQDETYIRSELRAARVGVEDGIKELGLRLRDIDSTRLGEGKQPFDFGDMSDSSGFATAHMAAMATDEIYTPWKPAGVDRLLMKLDFGTSGSSGSEFPYASGFYDGG